MRVFLLALAALCVARSVAAAPVLDAPWVREPPPGQATAAIYLVLHNAGETPLVLNGARVSGAASAAVHGHSMEGGMMRMREAGPLTLAPGGSLTLEPGGFHLMVFGLGLRPVAGERLPFCLRFEGAAEACAEAVVKAVGE